MNRAILLLVPFFFLASSARAQLTPEEALKKFTVADGLQVELFAAEPMLINPTSIDVDEKGRVWVCEAVNYRISRKGIPLYRPEGDRIVILEDTDGDGKADKSHVFYQAKDFIAPLGIAIAPIPPSPQRKQGGYRVFVCHHSDILIFEDKDGDLKADGPPTKLLSGFGGFDTDHGLHGINIGPDGKLYFTVGDAGVKNVQSSDGKGPKWTSNQTDCRAGTVWRCDQDGKNLELIAHNFRNHYECCVNSFGEIWTSDNDDDGSQQTRLCYVMPGGNYGYHPRGPGQSHWHEEQPGIVPKVLRTGFGSPSGICFYEGTLLPKKYQGQLLHCDAGPREFRCFHLTPKGAGYEAEKEVLVTSSDNWFRLSDCCVAPDGSVMIADWYDPGVGGNGMGDWTRGRIYRVTPKGHKGYKAPEAKVSECKEFAETLASPNLTTRALAIAKILELKPEEARIWLDEAKIRSKDLALMSRIYTQYPKVQSRYLSLRSVYTEMFEAPEPEIRIAGLRLADAYRYLHTLDQFGPQFDTERVENLAAESSPAVRREVLLAIRHYGTLKAAPSFSNLANAYDGRDVFYRAAINIACGNDKQRREYLIESYFRRRYDWNDRLADLAWELRPKSLLPRLGELLGPANSSLPTLSTEQKARIIDVLAGYDDYEAGTLLLKALGKNSPAAVRERALENLKVYLPMKWEGLDKNSELTSAIDQMLDDPAMRSSSYGLIAAAGRVNYVNRIRDLALEEKNAVAKREAISALGKLQSPQAVEALERIAADIPLAPAVIDAIGQHLTTSPRQTNKAADIALRFLQNVVQMPVAPDNTPAMKQAALATLAGGFNGTQWLLDAHEKKQLPQDLIADAGKLLRNSPYQGLRNRALALFPTPNKLDPKKLPPLAELAKRIGDVERGQELWAASFRGETQCAKCHTVNGRGGQIGPDLSAIGKKASKENLFESIILPSKAIADQYLQWKIETTAGQNILGLIVEETPNAVTIRDANGKDTKISKTDIESRTKSLVSIMPEDIVKSLTEDDLVDLAAYLFTLRTEAPADIKNAPKK